MKPRTEDDGTRWWTLSDRDTKKACDVASMCEQIAFTEKHNPLSSSPAQAAADALAAFLASRVASLDEPKDDKPY